MQSTTPIDAVLSSIARADRLLVTAHARPDGDAIGSLLACWMVLQRMEKHAEMALSDRVPRIYRGLPCASQIQHWSEIEGDYDTVILLECDGIPRTGLGGLENRVLINIDHHTSGRAFANVNWIDSSACAVGELIYRLAGAAGISITPEMATCLYTAVLSDTGSFCYEGTDAHTFELARNLVRQGADPVLIAQNVYFSNPKTKIHLLGAALANLHQEGCLAWLWVSRDDMDRTQAVEEDCEGIVNYAISIAGIEVAVFLRELRDHSVRLSLRSKGQVNVATIAERFGGGGHENASGCTLEGPLPAATERILMYLRREAQAPCH
jgi:phosphoesterase RecJ-like protein